MKSVGIVKNYIITGFTSTRQNDRRDEIVKDPYGAYQKLYYEDKGLKDYTGKSIESIGERL